MQQTEGEVKIESLKELVDALYSGNYEAIEEIDSIEFEKEEFADYQFWDTNRYTRNCIARNDEFELVLLCWKAGQKTAIHSHNEQECFVKIINGEFEEVKYVHNEVSEAMLEISRERLIGSNLSINNTNEPFHSLENISNGSSMTLHLYMAPIEECMVYSSSKEALETKYLSYHSDKGELL